MNKIPSYRRLMREGVTLIIIITGMEEEVMVAAMVAIMVAILHFTL